MITRNRFSTAVRAVSLLLIITFLFTTIMPPGYAQTIGLSLPIPGTMINASPAFVPVLLKGMTVHPDNPLQFDFIIDSGHEKLAGDELKKESERLVKYFLASMTVPQNDLWVNLSPYEENRIIPEELGKTELGRDLLSQDYILKQLTATMMYPEENLGKKFWNRIRKLAKDKYGITDIPTDTFNKVWILPERAEVYEHENTVYITDAHLKVMLDTDYFAMTKTDDQRPNTEQRELTESVVREIILPEIEKEVNTGKNFAPLRQIYHSLILAKWYKQTVKNSIMSQVYIDKNKTAGIELNEQGVKEKIYDRYMQAYKKGVFDYIKEDYDELSQTVIPRQYFSGGFKDEAMLVGKTENAIQVASAKVGNEYTLRVETRPEGANEVNGENDQAMISEKVTFERRVGEVASAHFEEVIDTILSFIKMNRTSYDLIQGLKNYIDALGSASDPAKALEILNRLKEYFMAAVDNHYDYYRERIKSKFGDEILRRIKETRSLLDQHAFELSGAGIVGPEVDGVFDLNDPSVRELFEREYTELVSSETSSESAKAYVKDAYERKQILPVHYSKFPDGEEERYYLQARQFFVSMVRAGFERPTMNNIHLVAAIYYHLEEDVSETLPEDPVEKMIALFKINKIEHILEVGALDNIKFAIMMNDIAKKAGGIMNIIDLDSDNETARKNGITTINGDARNTRELFSGKTFDLVLSSGVLSHGGVGSMTEIEPPSSDEMLTNGFDLLKGMIDSLSDNPKAAVISNGLRSHLVLEQENVKRDFNVRVWDNGFKRHDFYDSHLENSYGSYETFYGNPPNVSVELVSFKELRRLKSTGASLIVVGKKNTDHAMLSSVSKVISARIANKDGMVEEEFLVDGKNSPRNISLSYRDLSTEEKHKMGVALNELVIDEQIVRVLRRDDSAIKHRIYGLAADGLIFIREDIIQEGSLDQIKEALDHERMELDGKFTNDRIRAQQYQGGLHELIRKLSDKDKAASVGGIDMNEIDIDRQISTEAGQETHTIQFNMQGMEPLLNMDIQGFSPVIIDMIPINSVLPLLGLNPEEELGPANKQEELALFSMN